MELGEFYIKRFLFFSGVKYGWFGKRKNGEEVGWFVVLNKVKSKFIKLVFVKKKSSIRNMIF